MLSVAYLHSRCYDSKPVPSLFIGGAGTGQPKVVAVGYLAIMAGYFEYQRSCS